MGKNILVNPYFTLDETEIILKNQTGLKEERIVLVLYNISKCDIPQLPDITFATIAYDGAFLSCSENLDKTSQLPTSRTVEYH